MKRAMWILLAVCVLVFAVADNCSAVLIAGYNETARPSVGIYWVYSIGWIWESPIDFELTRIETFFKSGDRNVGIEVYDDLPHLGGVLLASARYDAVGRTWGGADIGLIPILAGEDYLIGFTKIMNFGASFTEEDGSTSFSIDGRIHYDSDFSAPPSYVTSYVGKSNAMIRIYGDIPEPATISLLALGALLLRKKKAASI